MLLVIDPQNDFVSPTGALSVPGAVRDMDRLAAWLDRSDTDGIHDIDDVDEIWVSLDTHHRLDISHPAWWVDEKGAPPAPFTRITAEDIASGRFRTADPAAQERSAAYVQALEASGRYPHVIWPEHCLIGGPGGNVWPSLHSALYRWQQRRARNVSWVFKGTNPWTEHFSAVRAEVPDPADPGGAGMEELVRAAARADRVLVAGEARSHCVANTVRDLIAVIDDKAFASRVVLLLDATSDVPGFESYGERFVQECTALGMKSMRIGDQL